MLRKYALVLAGVAIFCVGFGGMVVKDHREKEARLHPPCYAVSHGQCIRIGKPGVSAWTDENGPAALLEWVPGFGPSAKDPIDLEDYSYVDQIATQYPTLRPQVRRVVADHVVTQGEFLSLYVQAAAIDRVIANTEATKDREAVVKGILSH